MTLKVKMAETCGGVHGELNDEFLNDDQFMTILCAMMMSPMYTKKFWCTLYVEF